MYVRVFVFPIRIDQPSFSLILSLADVLFFQPHLCPSLSSLPACFTPLSVSLPPFQARSARARSTSVPRLDGERGALLISEAGR